jgi:tetratricopeptide (TPR) repeat protein
LLKLFLLPIFLFNYFSSSSTSEKDFLNAGDNSYGLFDNRNAVKYYEEAYQVDPASYECIFKLTRSFNDLGEELYIQNKNKEAEAYINKAVALAGTFKNKFPDSADAYTYEAMCLGNYALFKGGKEKVKLANQIEDDAKKAIEMDPGRLLSYIILGIYYRELASLSWLEKLFANTFFGKLPSGSYDDSINMFNKALSIDPEVIVAEYHLSKIYGKLGNDRKEIYCLQKTLEFPIKNFRDKYVIEKAKRRLKDQTGK